MKDTSEILRQISYIETRLDAYQDYLDKLRDETQHFYDMLQRLRLLIKQKD